ncbi:MAG: DUF3267 domain-containing protein [Anaerolineae bacterium]
MTLRIIDALPPGYVLHGDMFSDENAMPGWKWLLIGNLLALVPLGAAVLIVWLPYQFYAALGAPLAIVRDPGWSPPLLIGCAVVVIALSMAAHELIHAAALALMGHRPRLNIAYGYLFATIRPGDFLTRRQYVIMSRAPLIVLTLAGIMLAVLLPPSLGQIVVITVLLNAAASVGDLAVSRRALRYPADTLFADERGIKIYVRQAANQHQPIGR